MTRSFPREQLTPKQFAVRRARQQIGLLACVNDLHDAGFAFVIVESQAIGSEDYWVRIVIAKEELGSDELDTLMGVALLHNGKLSLRNDYNMGPRLSVWLPRDGKGD